MKKIKQILVVILSFSVNNYYAVDKNIVSQDNVQHCEDNFLNQFVGPKKEKQSFYKRSSFKRDMCAFGAAIYVYVAAVYGKAIISPKEIFDSFFADPNSKEVLMKKLMNPKDLDSSDILGNRLLGEAKDVFLRRFDNDCCDIVAGEECIICRDEEKPVMKKFGCCVESKFCNDCYIELLRTTYNAHKESPDHGPKALSQLLCPICRGAI